MIKASGDQEKIALVKAMGAKREAEPTRQDQEFRATISGVRLGLLVSVVVWIVVFVLAALL